MDVTFFKNKRVTVFGLGLHGGSAGTVKFLASHGAQVIVTDIKNREELALSIEKLKGLKNITYILGQHRQEDFTNVDMVVKNPAVPWNNEYVKLAIDRNVPVEMDSSLFFKLCKYPIVGVTGTKGKTTTATVIYEILKLAGRRPVKLGIGQEPVMDKIDLLKKDSIPVFELSSWRLSALGREKLSPHVAVFTNFHPDHLNYYKSIESYLKDKKYIFLNQKPTDWLIFNGDDGVLCEAATEARAQTIQFSCRCPREISGRGVFLDGKNIVLDDGIDQRAIVALEEIKLYGEHNIFNIMAAVGACYACGVGMAEIRKAILNFKGVPHRLEFVREVRGVRYYNDTASTIPQSTILALRSFTQPVILIAGGSDKNLDFSEMGQEIVQRVKGVVFLKGKGTEKLLTAVRRRLSNSERGRDFEVADSMDKAVEFAYRSAEAGDIVLLSPGAASFGLFQNEFDRGDKFREAVKKLIG